MYGMVNDGVRTFIIESFGEKTWNRIAERAGVPVSYEPLLAYDDAVTIGLVSAASEELNISPEQVLETFGDFWIDFASDTMIGRLLSFGGETLFENLYNLDEMHERIQLSLPHLAPPSFRFEESDGEWHRLHYRSGRDGLQPMVIGLLKGLARSCGTQIEVRLEQSRLSGADHDIFALRVLEVDKRDEDAA